MRARPAAETCRLGAIGTTLWLRARAQRDAEILARAAALMRREPRVTCTLPLGSNRGIQSVRGVVRQLDFNSNFLELKEQ